jgi:hypothetical protein
MLQMRRNRNCEPDPRKARRFTATLASILIAALLFASIILSANVGAATHAPPIQSRKCNISGWSATDAADGSAVAVRAKPWFGSRILGTLPTDGASYAGPKPRFLAEFDIVESHNGWFRIANARIIAIQGASYDAHPVKISGWIEPTAIRFSIQSSHGFASPDKKSEIRASAPAWVMTSWRVLYNCNDKWAEVETSPEEWDEDWPRFGLPRPRAWFRGICGSSMIGCDDVTGD